VVGLSGPAALLIPGIGLSGPMACSVPLLLLLVVVVSRLGSRAGSGLDFWDPLLVGSDALLHFYTVVSSG